jgi:hypothetical protein
MKEASSFRVGTELKGNPTLPGDQTQRSGLHHERLHPHRACSEIFVQK